MLQPFVEYAVIDENGLLSMLVLKMAAVPTSAVSRGQLDKCYVVPPPYG